MSNISKLNTQSVDLPGTEEEEEDDAFEGNLELGHTPVSITFQNIYLTVQIGKQYSFKPKETKVILNGISGEAKPGQLLAILGGSGMYKCLNSVEDFI
jgi:hypothetical protein